MPSHQTFGKFSLLTLPVFAECLLAICSPVRLPISLQRSLVSFFPLHLTQGFSNGNLLSIKVWRCMALRSATSASPPTKSFMIPGWVQFLRPFFSAVCPSTHLKTVITGLSATSPFVTWRTSNRACFFLSTHFLLDWHDWEPLCHHSTLEPLDIETVCSTSQLLRQVMP